VNTVNTTEQPESPAEEPRESAEQPREGAGEPREDDDGIRGADAAPRGESLEQPHEVEDAPRDDADEPREEVQTALYVRRKRTPALGFWVLLSFVVPGAAALLAAPLFQFGDLRGVVNFVILAMVVVGLPLAAIASFIDARRHRGEGRGRR
jgi:hypothetical protein